MIKLLFGEEKYMLDLEVTKFKNEYTFDAIFNFDLESAKIEEIERALTSHNLFSDKSLVILKSGHIENVHEDLVKIIESENIVNDLLICTYQQLDKRKKLFKLLNSKYSIQEFKHYEVKDLKGFVLNNLNLKNLTISENALNSLIQRSNNDMSFLVNQLNKLIYFKEENNEITLDDIELIVSVDLNQNAYSLSDYILRLDKKASLRLYFKLLNYVDIFGLIGLVTKTFRNILLAKEFSRYGLSQNELAKIIGISPGQLYYVNKLTGYNVKDLLLKMSNLELDIKSGRIDKNVGFELFLLSL